MSGSSAGAGAVLNLPGVGMVGGPAVEPIDGNGQIAFQPGPQFMEKWQEHWSQAGVGMGIGTPMQEAFDRADAAIASANLKGDLAVVAVTDGAPNCFPQTDTSTELEVDRAKHWLDTRNIKTYVVGLPGADGVQLLNDVAANGGTSEYILPDDPKMLEDKLRALVQETIKTRFDSCSIHLMPAADQGTRPDFVHHGPRQTLIVSRVSDDPAFVLRVVECPAPAHKRGSAHDIQLWSPTEGGSAAAIRGGKNRWHVRNDLL